MQTTLNFLKQNKNIFITDVDSLWAKYKDLNKLPKQFDTFHGTGTKWPPNAFEEWGFVLCGCVQGYHSNSNTIKFFETLLDKCGNSCDDQAILNRLFLEYGTEWENSPGLDDSVRIGYTKTNTGQMTSMVFSEKEVKRGKNLAEYLTDCQSENPADKAWIMSPNIPKTMKKKLQMYDSLRECLDNSTRGLVDEFLYF